MGKRHFVKTSITVATCILLLSSCGLVKAIDYSFYVPEHGEYDINGTCFGIEDQQGERLLITDCGGYLNVIVSTLTLGMSRSVKRTSRVYLAATNQYLKDKYGRCEITRSRDLGGRMFEIIYRCKATDEKLRLPA